jgi:hypothetical protein
MPFSPELSVEKSSGDLIRSQDWNDVIHEVQRLNMAKVNKVGDTITGPLTINGTLPNHGTIIFFSQSADIEYNGGADKLFLFRDNGGKTAFIGGNIGIGTTDPRTKLEVTGTIKASKLQLAEKWLLSGDGDAQYDDDWLRLLPADGTNKYYGGFAAKKLWSEDGTVVKSDLRMKWDINSLIHPLEDLLTLRGVRFKLQGEEEESIAHLGLIAQEVEAVFPELVETGPNGMKGIRYDGLAAPLIEAVKQQQLQIDELRAEIESLKNK